MSWDYIIIGAGSAGCALAYELAKGRPDATMLILEAGGSDRSPFIRIPAGAVRALSTYDWGYRSQPDPSRNGVTEPWWRGKVLGGCSSINSTVFVRGAAEDFDRWDRQLAASSWPGWSASEVMPIFRELETSDQSGALRGQGGPLRVRTVKRPHAISEAFMSSARAAGFPFTPDYNGEVQEGVAYAQVNQRGGWRCNSADAFLRPLLERMNVDLRLNALVEKIAIDKGRATGVCFSHRGKDHHETAREVILCAGALNSPKVLMLSGVGERSELERHRIPVNVDLPGVGRKLKDHPILRMIYQSRVPTYNLTEGLRQKMGMAAKFLFSHEGPISNVFESVAFLRTQPIEPAPDVQLHFSPLAYLALPDGTIKLADYPAVAVLVNKSHPSSSGRIRLASADPRAAPLIECRMLEREEDVDTLVRGIDMVRKIMQTEPLASLLDTEVTPGAQAAGQDALKAHVRSNTLIANHPVGTCRMGTDADAVVEPGLRVRGVENLWVADASIMPDLISGNTNAACMMIGAKLGRQLTARKH